MNAVYEEGGAVGRETVLAFHLKQESRADHTRGRRACSSSCAAVHAKLLVNAACGKGIDRDLCCTKSVRTRKQQCLWSGYGTLPPLV